MPTWVWGIIAGVGAILIGAATYCPSDLKIVKKARINLSGENSIALPEKTYKRLNQSRLPIKMKKHKNYYACFFNDTLRLMKIIEPEIITQFIRMESKGIPNNVLKHLYSDLEDDLLIFNTHKYMQIEHYTNDKNYDYLTFRLTYPNHKKNDMYLLIEESKYFKED